MDVDVLMQDHNMIDSNGLLHPDRVIMGKFTENIEKNSFVGIENSSITKIDDSNIDVYPTGLTFRTKFSPNGIYLVVTHQVSPFITIYKSENSTFTKLPDPVILPTGTATSASFSSDSNYLAISHYTTPFITIYRRDNDTFTKLANPTILPAGDSICLDFSSDNTYLAICHANTPFITIYSVSGETFTKVSNPNVLPTTMGQSVSFSPTEPVLAAGFTSSNNDLMIYHYGTGVFLSIPKSWDAVRNMTELCFAPNGLDLALSDITNHLIQILRYYPGSEYSLVSPYRITGTSGWDKDIYTPKYYIPGYCSKSISYSPSGNYLAISYDVSPYIRLFEKYFDRYVEVVSDILPPNSARGIAFSPDEKYLAVAHYTAPYLTIYSTKLYRGLESAPILSPTKNPKFFANKTLGISLENKNIGEIGKVRLLMEE